MPSETKGRRSSSCDGRGRSPVVGARCRQAQTRHSGALSFVLPVCVSKLTTVHHHTIHGWLHHLFVAPFSARLADDASAPNVEISSLAKMARTLRTDMALEESPKVARLYCKDYSLMQAARCTYCVVPGTGWCATACGNSAQTFLPSSSDCRRGSRLRMRENFVTWCCPKYAEGDRPAHAPPAR
jgi:hypothetical protein